MDTGAFAGTDSLNLLAAVDVRLNTSITAERLICVIRLFLFRTRFGEGAGSDHVGHEWRFPVPIVRLRAVLIMGGESDKDFDAS